jgi:hypothetical protein
MRFTRLVPVPSCFSISAIALLLAATGVVACAPEPESAEDDSTDSGDGDPGDGDPGDGDSGDGDGDPGDGDGDGDLGDGGELDDDFAGTGPLLGYTTNNPDALPDVTRVDGRYHANLIDNTNDITLHYHTAQGRLDAKLVEFPFEVIARNIGIGTQADSQVAPAAAGDPYVFAGVQVHVMDLDERTSAHVVVGHRGPTSFTVEGKNTTNGSSSVDDDGSNIVPDGRADIRIVGELDHTLTVYWQQPNPAPGVNADAWNLYGGDGLLPGEPPPFGSSGYVGLITYAYGQTAVPFVGTCDELEGGSL